MTKHTPAPWRAILGISDRHGEITNGKYKIAFVDCRYGAIGEPEANARLIAAAPELLEALEFIFEQVTNEKNHHHTLGAFSHGVGIDMAKKAITKAKGEA